MATLMSYFASPIAGEWGDEAEDNTDGVPVLRTTNFTADGRLSYDDLTYRSIDTEKKENKILQPGDIIIEKSGGTPKKPVGRCVYFDRDDDYDYFCSNFTAILRANSEEVNTKYLWYILQEHYKTRQCLKYQYKTNGIANLDIKDYLSHKDVELPPREVQDKRVEAMDYSQYLLDLHQELLEIMDNAVKSRFIEMFGDPVINDKGWPKDKLKNHADVIVGYPFASSQYTADGLPIVGGYNLMQGFVQWENSKFWPSPEGYEQYLLKDKDIVIAMDRPWVGSGFKIAIIEKADLPAILIQRTACIRCKDIPTQFLYRLLDSAWFADHCQITGSLVPHISNKDILNYEIIVPPLDLQNQFADFVALTDKSKLTIQKSMDNLRELRDSLLQEYFG